MIEQRTSKGRQKILVTSALPYANGHLHLGHIAGAYLPGDAFVRYQRLKGNDVVYICGSDEHGTTITVLADSLRITPQALVDKYHESLRSSFEALGMSFNNYSRTSLPIHHQTTQEFFLEIHKKGALVQRTVKQLFCARCDLFLADRYISGTCPHCKKPGAKGDQCEKCGKPIDPIEIPDATCVRCQGKPEVRETKHWFFSLNRYQDRLRQWLAGKPHWKPNVLNFCTGVFESGRGLEERCITRDLPWGVKVPLPDHEGKVLYVWFDAPIGYISSTKEWAARTGNPERWKDYWCDPNCRLVHFIGKDNIFFHALLFPAMLMEHGGFVLPDHVPANEFLNLEGEKFSTSRNYAVWLPDFLAKFPPDSLRYSLARIAPETKDADFSWKEFQAHHNNELADILGNFVNRTLTFAKRYFDNRVPPQGPFGPQDQAFLETLRSAPDEIGDLLDHCRLRDASVKLMDIARAGNVYFDQQEPWRARKDDPGRCGTTIHLCIQACRSLATLMHPVLPFSSEVVWRMLNLPGKATDHGWDEVQEPSLPEGHRLGEPEILYRKIEDAVIEAEIAKLRAAAAPSAKPQEPQKLEVPLVSETISYDEFSKLDLRVAEVLAAEKVPNTDKLLKLSVRVGPEIRPLVAGIAQHYPPESLVGRKIVIVANLEPAKIRGIESRGMLLAADAGGVLSLVVLDKSVDSGAKVR
jgi:methionyl-tRNA synthetase